MSTPAPHSHSRSLALAVTAVVVGALLAPFGVASAALAEVTAVLGVSKTASATTVAPGESFDYTLAVSCGSLTDVGCRDAQLVDSVPPQFEILGVSVGSSLGANTQAINGQTVTVSFVSDLGDGTTGIIDNVTGPVTISVRLRADTPYEANGVPITNTVSASASNADTQTAAIDVTPVVELQLATEASKSFNPTSGPNTPGEVTSATLGGTNLSNSAVETLVISDPVDPTLSPSAFDYLAYTSITSVTYPAGADTVVLELWNGTAWVAGPPATGGATPTGPPAPVPADAGGIRLVFSSSAPGANIEAGAQAGVVVGFEQRPEVASLPESITVANTVSSTVTHGVDQATGVNGADYRIIAEPILVEASKSFSPDAVLAGTSSTVTLGATNTGETELQSLTIREPATGSFTTDAAFTGFVGTSVFPQGADTGELVFSYRLVPGGPLLQQTYTITNGAAYPAVPAGAILDHFVITYADNGTGGLIISGASTEVKFTVEPDPALPGGATIPNIVGVDGAANGTVESDDASANLTILEKHLEVATSKKINPGQLIGVAGQRVLVQLPTQLLSPESTTSADTIIVQDPQGTTPAEILASEWWQYFDATTITKTDVPPGATLTVRYFDTTDNTWKELPGAVGIVGATTFSMDIPAALQPIIGGLQFEYTNPAGFPPGTTLQPNFSAVLTQNIPPAPASNVLVENCSSAAAQATGVDDATATVPPPCPEVELIAPTPGVGDLINKNWLTDVVSARSDERATARLSWSTGGYNGLDEVVIADVANPPSTNAEVAASVFQAFNLIAVEAISPAIDPLIQYDTVTAVELWNGSAWVEAANSPCATTTACQGALPRIPLTLSEQASTTSVRLRFAEYTDARTGSAPIDAPLPGSGVASSFGNNRNIDLVFQVRDLVRVEAPGVSPDPALGNRIYNTATPGDVRNTASATGFTGGDQIVRDESADVITILDRPLNTTVTKGWSGGPLGIPPAGTPAASYPSGRVTIVASNATVARVDTLQISDPAPGSTVRPFEQFDLKSIVSIAEPAGSVSGATEVFVTRSNGVTTSYSRVAALALTEAALADAVGISVAFHGRIASTAQGALVLDLRLRATQRTGGAPVTVSQSPVHNDAQSTVQDLGGVNGQHTASATDTSEIRLEDLNISVLTTKTFTPRLQQQPNNAPILMMLTARPGGSARTASMVVTDDRTTFWNAFDFVGFDPSFTLAAPITRVQVDAFRGGVFITGPANSLTRDDSAGEWVLGVPSVVSPGSPVALPAGVSPGDVQALRFTFTRADGSQWENPANPLQQLPILVQRRDTFRSGEANLPTGLATVPAPGEVITNPGGSYTNTVVATVTSSTNGSGSLPLTAEHSTTTRALYVRADSKVSVVKGPVGAQKPGEQIPFTLEVSNTSDVSAILDPVITDHIPTAVVNGVTVPQLIFDPDATGSPYSYERVVVPSTTTPGKLPMPTDPNDVTVVVSPDQTQIQFSFAEDTVLEPGETYRITIMLMFRPGIVANTTVTNSFDISASDPFTSCNGSIGISVLECATDTDVYPVETGALRGRKFVKADDTELGNLNFENPSQSAACTTVPGIPDFYGYPCVPITKPGGTETWLEALQNMGTQPIDQIVTIDRLPTPGDSGAQISLPRGSEWAPRWEGDIALGSVGVRTPTLTSFYSAAADPCVADLDPLGTQCDPGAWLPLTSSVDPTTVRQIKTVFDFGAEPLLPGEYMSYTFKTRTPAYSPALRADSIAWNTVATGARTVLSSGGNGSVLPSEGRRVGVALATGSLEVIKRVTGDGASFAPSSFSAQVQCTSAVGTPVEAAVPPVDVVLVNGVKQQVDNLPWGAECVLVETDQGQSSQNSTTAVVGRSDEPLALVTLTNDYPLAAIDIVKTLDSSAVDENGDPVSYGPFEVSLQCTFLGAAVFATGYSAQTPMVKALSAGEHWLLTGLPARAECTVTESDAKGAAPTITVTTDAGTQPPVTGNTASVTLTPLAQGAASVTIDISNAFGVGSITIEKVVTGPGAADFGAGPFTVQLVCTLSDASGTRTVWSGTIELGGDQPLTASVDNIAAGALCTVTEIQTGGADTVAVSPDTPVAVGADEVVTFTVTNTFEIGSLHVVKQRSGAGAELYGAGPFTVSLSCVELMVGLVEIPGGAERVLSSENGYSADYSSLPVGALCSLRETGTGGATTSTITDADGDPHSGFIVQRATTAELVVENVFDVGAVQVNKQLAGSGATEFGDRSFVVQLSCTRVVNGETVPVAVSGGPTRTLSKQTSLTARYEMLPLGAVCTLTETNSGGAASVAITPNAGDSTRGSVVVGAGDPVTITVVNTFNATLGATGTDAMPALLAALAVLLLGGGLLGGAELRRRRGGRSARAGRTASN